jgi:hypothetical protein
MIQLQMLANDLLDFTTLLDQEHQGMVLVLQSLSLIQTKPTLFQGILYRVTALENLCSGYVYLPSTSGTLALETLKVKSSYWNLGIGENPVQIGDYIFNSKEDVWLWVEENAFGVSFSLFHGLITLKENLTKFSRKKLYQKSIKSANSDSWSLSLIT